MKPPQQIVELPRSSASIMGRRLGNYQVRALIGCGAMGAVYLAHDAVLDRPVALKVLLGSLAKSPEQLRRFQREARAAAPLSHPNIVRIYEAGVREGIPFIAMEYVDGESFDHLLARAAVVPWREALEIAGQMALALDCAHEHGVVHRDVKPSNMLIDKSGRLRLTDFGIARVRDQSTGLTEHDLFIGTPEFMSPEQCMGSADIGPASDLFSLGVTLYRMISGRMPFAGFNTAALLASITRETPVRLNRILPEVPDDVARLVAHLLEKDPAARPESAEAVATAIDSLLENDGGASAMSAALDAFIRDQAKPRQIEVWNTPTPREKEKTKSAKRGPIIRQKKRRQFYAPVSFVARATAAGMLACAALGAAYWYLAVPAEVAQAAPLLDKAVFAAEQRGIYRMPLPAGPWMVRNLAWAPGGETLLVALVGRPGSTMHGAEGIISVSPADGSIRSLRAPSAPWRGEATAPLSLSLAGMPMMPNRPAGVNALANDGYMLRLAQTGSGHGLALARHPLRGDAPLLHPVLALPDIATTQEGAPLLLGSAVSPDGACVAVAMPSASGEGYKLYLNDLGGREQRPAAPLNTDPMAVSLDSMTFTPDGGALILVADGALYRFSRETAGRVEILARADFAGAFSVHPVGSHALVNVGPEERSEVYLVALDGSSTMKLIDAGVISTRAYTPNGAMALLAKRDDTASMLMRVDPARPESATVLARFEGEQLSPPAISAGGNWAAATLSSDGTQTLLIVDMTATASASPVNASVPSESGSEEPSA